MKGRAFIAVILLAGIATADNVPLTAGLLGSTRKQIQSEVKTENAWQRDVVMVQDGNIIGDGGTVGEKVATDAIDAAASNSYLVAVAANAAMTNAMEYVYAHTNQMAKNCVQFALAVAPETVRSNLTGFVVKTETVGNTDHQWVWYDRVLALRPNRFVTYSKLGEESRVKCQWVNWTTNGVSVTVNGRTWDGCHECTIERPAMAQGEVCLDLPNETWGGDNGIDFGDMVLNDGTMTYYTGFVTNGVTDEVIYFDNGFYKPNP